MGFIWNKFFYDPCPYSSVLKLQPPLAEYQQDSTVVPILSHLHENVLVSPLVSSCSRHYGIPYGILFNELKTKVAMNWKKQSACITLHVLTRQVSRCGWTFPAASPPPSYFQLALPQGNNFMPPTGLLLNYIPTWTQTLLVLPSHPQTGTLLVLHCISLSHPLTMILTTDPLPPLHTRTTYLNYNKRNYKTRSKHCNQRKPCK